MGPSKNETENTVDYIGFLSCPMPINKFVQLYAVVHCAFSDHVYGQDKEFY